MRELVLLLAIFLALLAVTLWSPFSIAENDADVTGDFGEPIPGLDVVDRLSFDRGREVFVSRFRRSQGLGPHFNAVSCASCHEDPMPGGSSQRYRDFYLLGEAAAPVCTVSNADTDRTELCLPSVVVPQYGPSATVTDPAASSVSHPPIPATVEIRSLRNAPPLFGIGLFRLVADEVILAGEDALDEDDNGVSGRANRIAAEDNAVGRFGFKCQTASIEAFNRGALLNQMGITSNSIELAMSLDSAAGNTMITALLGTPVAHAQVAEPRNRTVDFDGVPDPEITRGQLIDLVFFQENLAAPRRGRITASVRRGEEVFDRIGCTGCHFPSLPTSLGLIHPYTDLLLHDMGPGLGDGISMALASGSEFRTQPLWGLCQHAPFLHDGSADTVEQAILLHGGEATTTRGAYTELSPPERTDLHLFLESL